MSGIDQNFCLRAGGARKKQRHAPIGDVGMVESRFERLVLNKKSLSRRQSLMRFLQKLGEPLLALPNICRSRIVGAVGKPHGDVAAMETTGDLDAVFRVLQRSLPDGWIGIAVGAIFVFLVLK